LESVKTFPALAVTLAVATLLLTACGSARGVTTTSSTTTGTTTTSSAAPRSGASGSHPAGSPARVFGRVFDNPGVTATGGRLYVTWQVNPVTAAVPRFELARVDQATGVIKATHILSPGQVGTPLAAGGWLWVPVATSAGESVLRLNPADLAQAGELPVTGGSLVGIGLGSHLAVAGGTLWVAGGDRLLRVSLTTGRVIAAIPLPGAYTSGVAANEDGTVLVVSEANDGGIGSVQRRDPVTGALLASHPMLGVTAPGLVGIIDAGVWISEPTGLQGYVERFRTATMSPDPATDVTGDNGIRALVADSVVWITDLAGPDRDHCADPVTGRILARIVLPDPLQDGVLAVSGRYLYYDAPASNGFYLERLPIPGACRG
jgi:hypothetical protein